MEQRNQNDKNTQIIRILLWSMRGQRGESSTNYELFRSRRAAQTSSSSNHVYCSAGRWKPTPHRKILTDFVDRSYDRFETLAITEKERIAVAILLRLKIRHPYIHITITDNVSRYKMFIPQYKKIILETIKKIGKLDSCMRFFEEENLYCNKNVPFSV